MTNKNPPTHSLFWNIVIGLLSIICIYWMSLERRKLEHFQGSIAETQKELEVLNNSLDAIAQQQKWVEQLETKVANLKTQFQNRMDECPSVDDLPIIQIPDIVVVSSKNVNQPKFRILVPEGQHQLHIAVQGVVNRSTQPETIDWDECIQLPPHQWQQLEFLVETNSDEIDATDLAAGENLTGSSTMKGLFTSEQQQRQLFRIVLSPREDPPQSFSQTYEGNGFYLPGEFPSAQSIDQRLPIPIVEPETDKTNWSFQQILELTGNEWNLKLTLRIISQ